jgi:hypothetical protein
VEEKIGDSGMSTSVLPFHPEIPHWLPIRTGENEIISRLAMNES